MNTTTTTGSGGRRPEFVPGRGRTQPRVRRDLRLPDEHRRRRAHGGACSRARATGSSARPRRADVILVNTCAIREHAETRVLGRIGQLSGLKRRRPWLVIGVTGCMAQRMGDTLLAKTPAVDLVMGPDGYRHLGEALGHRSSARRPGGEAPVGARSVAGRELPRPRAAPPLAGHRLDPGPARLQPPLHLLHRAVRAGAREEPRTRRCAAGGRAGGRRRHHRGHPAGADGQLLPARRLVLRAPAARRGPRLRHPASAVHLAPPQRRVRGPGRGHGDRTGGLRAVPPARAVREQPRPSSAWCGATRGGPSRRRSS